jgi:hypothetical protein
MNPKTLTIKERLFSGVEINQSTGCWEWKGAKDRKGYASLSIDGKQVKAHRQSYMQLVGPIPEGMMICHKCDNPSCINPEHLFAGTALDNSRDCISKGRQKPIGEKSFTAKLTDSEVLRIRKELASGAQKKHLGKKFGVSARAIFKIANGDTWKHLIGAGQPAAAGPDGAKA